VPPPEDTDRSIRLVTLLQEVARAQSPITANEISEQSGLPKATVYRLCDQLLAAGLIRRQLGGRGYVPGNALVDLAQTILSGRIVYATRHAILAKVAREVGETCNLVAPDGSEMVYWDRVETEWPLRLQLPIGSRVPLHATASGKMYLASLPQGQRAKICNEIELKAHTPSTLTSASELASHLGETHQRGYSLDDEEFIVGMTAVAVPVTDKAGRYIASLAVHAPKSRMDIATAKSYVDLLCDAAARIAEGIPESRRKS
jgi:IclR family transcriptional regulator, KDG regulon repressor